MTQRDNDGATGRTVTPDPLEPGHIDGQNPNTPERMPGHTRAVQPSGPDANEEELGGRPAFLFQCGPLRGVTLDSSGENLPSEAGKWTLERYFTLGIRDCGLEDIGPETLIRGIKARGYHVWSRADPSRMQATSQ